MSQADNQNPESRDTKVISGQCRHRISQSQDEPIYGDNSSTLFTIYSKYTKKNDDRLCERWQKDADGLIIFNGLFSAVLAGFVVASIQDLRPGPQDTSAFYLEKMYELQAVPNASSPSTPSTLSKPPAFSPPTYAVWVNTFWSLSLVISLSCAMLATLLQQWARRYILITQNFTCSPQERARLHEFFANGRHKHRFHRVVETLPVLVHLSLFLFFAGLIVYLSNINDTVVTAVICWVALLSAVYAFITFMPFIWINSPYYSPLTPPAWFLFTRVLYIVLAVLCGLMSLCCIPDVLRRIGKWVTLQVQRNYVGIWWEAQEVVSKQLKGIDFNILKRLLYLMEDDEQETVFESIPGFFKSDEIKLDHHRGHAQRITQMAMCHFLFNTLSSNAVHQSVKTRRLATCLNAASEVLSPYFSNVIGELTNVNWGRGLHSVAIGHSLRSWDKGDGGHFTPYIHGIVAIIVASARERDEPWAKLTRDHLGIPDDVFHEYQTHGNSVLLANLINYMRHSDPSEPFALKVVGSLSKFDTRDTLPELQRDFCAMWNDLAQQTQNRHWHAYSGYAGLLIEIRHHYIALHQSTDATPTTFLESIADHDILLLRPSSFPLCNILTHHSHSTAHHDHDVPAAGAFLYPPSTSRSLHCDSVLTTVTTTKHLLSTSSDPDDTETKPKDQSTTQNLLPLPVIPPSFTAPPVAPQHGSSHVTPSDPAISATKTTARHPSMSFAVIPDLDRPTLGDTISIPQPTFPLSADGTIAAVSSPPSTVPVVLSSSCPSNAPSTSSPSSPMPSPSRYTEAPSDEGIPHPSSSTMVPPATCQSSFDNGATVALGAPTDDPPDKSMV